MLKRFFLLLILTASALTAGGCVSTSEAEDPNRVSTIPWNRPEKWEGQGPLGGFNPGAR